MTEDLAEKALAVVMAARKWRAAELADTAEGRALPTASRPARIALVTAIDQLEEAITAAATNEPTGYILTRTWAEVPAGWFVQGPGTPGRDIPAPWYEVISTRQSPDGRQWVKLRVDGQVGEWPRDPRVTVRVRRGTAGPSDRDAALDALRAARINFTVLEDQTS